MPPFASGPAPAAPLPDPAPAASAAAKGGEKGFTLRTFFMLFVPIVCLPFFVLLFSAEDLLDHYYARHGLSRRVEQAGGFSIAFYDSGEEQLPAMVLVHGFLVRGGLNWCAVIPKLTGRFRLIIPDMLYADQEEISKKGYSLKKDALMLLELERLLGLEKPLFVLFSAGCFLAPYLQHSENLVLVSPPPGGFFFRKDVESLFSRDADWFAVSTFVSPPPGFSLHTRAAWQRNKDLMPLFAGIFLAQDHVWTKYAPPDTALVLLPDDDRYFPSAKGYFSHNFSHAVRILRRCGHGAAWDAAQSLADILISQTPCRCQGLLNCSASCHGCDHAIY